MFPKKYFCLVSNFEPIASRGLFNYRKNLFSPVLRTKLIFFKLNGLVIKEIHKTLKLLKKYYFCRHLILKNEYTYKYLLILSKIF